MPAGKPPFVGIGWDIGIGWYAWFGRPPYVVRVPLKLAEKPLKVAAKPLKAAGRFMAANPIIISGVIIVGLAGALISETQERNRVERAHAYESARAILAEGDRDVARSQLEAMERELERGHEMTLDISEDQISEIRNQLGINGDDRNIAVCGRVSTGKSAFVNAIRGLLPTSVDAAPIGNEETTTEMTPYRDPHLPAVVWWDIPGAGGQNSREWHYCSEQCLFAFDQVIIVHDQVFSQTECNIYRSCIEIGKEVLIVRTQSDNNMSRIRMENPELEGLSLVNRYVSESIRATESFLDNANLPKPRALYHITAQLLTRARDRSHIISAHPFLQNIDELPLLMKLGIPSIGETDGEGDRRLRIDMQAKICFNWRRRLPHVRINLRTMLQILHSVTKVPVILKDKPCPCPFPRLTHAHLISESMALGESWPSERSPDAGRTHVFGPTSRTNFENPGCPISEAAGGNVKYLFVCRLISWVFVAMFPGKEETSTSMLKPTSNFILPQAIPTSTQSVGLCKFSGVVGRPATE